MENDVTLGKLIGLLLLLFCLPSSLYFVIKNSNLLTNTKNTRNKFADLVMGWESGDCPYLYR